MKHCSRCGKELGNPEEVMLIGSKFTILTNSDPINREIVKKQLGKYYEDGKEEYEFLFCIECWIDSLMKGAC